MKEDGTKKMIFDVIRRKYVALTPEEWVRQHFVHYLIEQLGYPQELLANEVEVTLNGTSKRCDTVLYDRELKARMIVEYKAADIPIIELEQHRGCPCPKEKSRANAFKHELLTKIQHWGNTCTTTHQQELLANMLRH